MRLNQRTFKTANVKIGNLNWKVKLVNDYNKHLYDEGVSAKEVQRTDGAFGITDRQMQEIYVSKDMPTGNLKRTIRHELTHAVIYTYGLMASKRKLDEEEICNFMEIHSVEINRLTEKIYKKLYPVYKQLKKVEA